MLTCGYSLLSSEEYKLQPECNPIQHLERKRFGMSETTDLSVVGETSTEPAPDQGLWSVLREGKGSTPNVFVPDPEEEQYRQTLRQHKAWLSSLAHEYPSPYRRYRIGVYIRFFNQTKYEDYLDYHKKQFMDTIAQCPNWSLVDFYVDEGQSAPYMENAPGWCRLLEDCFAGRVDLIVTQKVSNVSRKPQEITFCARILASLQQPVGIYFISENLFTLASYYQGDLHDTGFLPDPNWTLLPDDTSEESWGRINETADDA